MSFPCANQQCQSADENTMQTSGLVSRIFIQHCTHNRRGVALCWLVDGNILEPLLVYSAMVVCNLQQIPMCAVLCVLWLLLTLIYYMKHNHVLTGDVQLISSSEYVVAVRAVKVATVTLLGVVDPQTKLASHRRHKRVTSVSAITTVSAAVAVDVCTVFIGRSMCPLQSTRLCRVTPQH